MPASKSLVWFITGCSTGFGRELAKLALERGDQVVLTARDPAKLADLANDYPKQALALPLDVNDKHTVTEAARQAESRFGRIDVLVNNAGYGYLAAIEEGEDAPVRAMFETNVFGLVEMTKAVLPGMRARKSGHIINISSIGGLAGFAATGYYHATKFAVEGLSESLAAEVEPLGIKVIAVEPGPFRTDWAGRSMQQSDTHIADYDGTAGERRKQTAARSGKQAGDPVRGAQAIITAVLSDTPPRHLLLGQMAYDVATKKLDSLRAEFEAWKSVTVGADYPG